MASVMPYGGRLWRFGEQGGAADVFKSAVDVVADVEQEEVMRERGRGGEHCQFGFADFADV